MELALTTRWNAGRHDDGEAMIAEILNLGFTHVELGFDLRINLVPGVKKMLEQDAVTVTSLHNFCPVPVGAPQGHPELYTLTDVDPRGRRGAIEHTTRTIRFAQEVGARAVVVHAGYVHMKKMTGRLVDMQEMGKTYSTGYERTRMKLQVTRERKAKRQLEYLYQGIEALMPVLQETGIKLALENLPTWEAYPTEVEMEALIQRFGNTHFGAWHDIGHGRIRQNLGFINQERWLQKIQDYLVGMHIHDVAPPAYDHLMPPEGEVDFDRLKPYASEGVIRVMEPSPRATPEEVARGRQVIQSAWA